MEAGYFKLITVPMNFSFLIFVDSAKLKAAIARALRMIQQYQIKLSITSESSMPEDMPSCLQIAIWD